MRHSKALVKFAISAFMLWIALRFVSLKDLESTISKIPVSTIISILSVYLLGQLLSSYKWWCIARSGGSIKAPFITALKAYFLGMYVNCFVGLGTVGGDVTRGVLLGHSEKARTEGVFSVVADRVHGLVVLSMIAIVSTAYYQRHRLDPTILYGLYGLAFTLIIGWFAGPAILLNLIPKENRFRSKVEGIASVFPRSCKTVLFITVLSLIFHTVQLSLHRVMADAVGAELSWEVIFTTIPFVNILASLPISWQGLGVRESAYLFFLGNVISNEQVVAFGAMWLCAMVVASAVGGVIAVISGDLKEIRNPQVGEVVSNLGRA